jgi:Helix-turn-helix of DDE superfamily endonuclease
MAGLRFGDVATRPTELLDLTSLTGEEFVALAGPFEAAFQAHMAQWRFDGQPRQARRYTTYANCPLPTAEDRLLFILVYLKTYPLQVVQGRLFGLPQGKTNQWIHVLLPVLQAALRQLGDAPSRSLEALAQRLARPPDTLAPIVAGPPEDATEAAPPLFAMTAPSGASRAPLLRMPRKAVIAARRSATR